MDGQACQGLAKRELTTVGGPVLIPTIAATIRDGLEIFLNTIGAMTDHKQVSGKK